MLFWGSMSSPEQERTRGAGEEENKKNNRSPKADTRRGGGAAKRALLAPVKSRVGRPAEQACLRVAHPAGAQLKAR